MIFFGALATPFIGPVHFDPDIIDRTKRRRWRRCQIYYFFYVGSFLYLRSPFKVLSIITVFYQYRKNGYNTEFVKKKGAFK